LYCSVLYEIVIKLFLTMNLWSPQYAPARRNVFFFIFRQESLKAIAVQRHAGTEHAYDCVSSSESAGPPVQIERVVMVRLGNSVASFFG